MRISDLLAIAELRLTLLAGDPSREFGTVHITDLPTPGRYLSGGELVLTGLLWRQSPGDSAAFVAALVEAGVAGLGAGQAWLGHIPADVVEACQAAGLALFEVPTEVSFRTIADLAVPRLAGDARDALGRQRRIVAAVAEGAELPELFALTAAELGITATVLSATGLPIVGVALEDPADAVRLARTYLTAPRLPTRSSNTSGNFTIFAVGRGHRAAGWMLACEGDLLDRADLGYELAASIALERSRMEEGRRVERRLVDQLITAALTDTDPADLNARLRTCGIDAAEPYAIVNMTMPSPGGPDAAALGGQVVEELLAREAVAPPGADGAVALVPLRGTSAEDLAQRLRRGTEVLSALPGTRVCVGLSGALTGANAIRGGIQEAGHARRLAEARAGGVVTSDEIYTHALLLATVPGDIRRSYADRLLAPLVAYDRTHQSDLVRTLGTFLDCTGSWNACAEQLHVHVNTVRYRIRRVEELTGRDLSTMADRVDFFLALQAT